MKKNAYFILAVVVMLLLQACGKETSRFSSFNINFEGFRSEEGEKLLIPNADFDRFLFSNGDKFYVNDVEFTIAQNGSQWQATSSTDVEADEFYCLYYDPINCSRTGVMNNNKYRVGFRRSVGSVNGLSAFQTGPAFAGKTTGNTVTMKPTFAIIHFRASNMSALQGVYVGFGENKVISSGQLLGQAGSTMPTVSGQNYFETIAVSTDPMDPTYTSLSGDMIQATRNYVDGDVSDQNAYYCIVPLASDNVTTDIYLMCHHINGNYYYQKFANKTLSRGVVYTYRW